MSWPLVKLGEVIQFIRGVTFKPDEVVAPFSVDSIVVMRTKNVQVLGLDTGDLIAISKKLVKRQEQVLLAGDLLLSSANSWELVGKSSYVEKLDYESTAGGFISIVRPIQDKIHPRYLYHWVTNPSIQHKIRHLGRKTTNISNLNVDRFKQLEIPLPPLDEQKRIAAILDKADAIRRKRQQAINLADDFLRSVFLDMFGADLQRSNNVTTFGDVSILDAKMVDPREEEYLDLLHVGPDRIEKNTGKLLPALTAREERLISKKFLFDNQYILYSKIRPYLRKVAVPDFRALCSADMYPIKPVQGKVTREFMWMLLLSDYFDNYVSSLPARANIPKLNKTELAAFEFSLPDFTKIEKFTEIVRISFEQSKTISDSNTESETLFNSLSQKAFAGEL